MNNDLISRDDLIKAACIKFYTTPYYKHILDLINNAPTISPFKPMCKAKDEAICEEMTTDGHCNCSKPCPNKESERTRGEWKEWTDERWGGTTIYCPYCRENALEKYIDGLHRQVKSNFCPNCGYDTRKETEE